MNVSKETEELIKDFQDFKAKTKAQFESYPILNEERFDELMGNVLRKHTRDEEKIRLMNRVYSTLLVSSIIIIMILGFILWTMWFTIPI